MGFTATETLKIDRKIAAGVLDASSSGEWFDSQVAYVPSILNKNVLTQFELIEPASNITVARANAASIPGIIADLSQDSSAIRMSVVNGTNGSTFLATTVYGSYGESFRLRNWIHPTRIPATSGNPSIGYAIRIFQGNPIYGGVEVQTTTGLTGVGVDASTAWIFNYDQGILLVSDDYKDFLTNPYILGFRYIGHTFADTLSNLVSQAELDLAETAIGINQDGTYQAPLNTTHLNASTSIMDAILKLDAAISNVAPQGDLFVLDVAPSNVGIVGDFVYATTNPPNKVILSCSSDTNTVRITVGVEGSSTLYYPQVIIAGATASVIETSTARWFMANSEVTLTPGMNTIQITSDSGRSIFLTVEFLTATPTVESIIFGAYPGVQTALKQGDLLEVTVTSSLDAVDLQLLALGAVYAPNANPITIPANSGVSTFNIVIGSGSGSLPITVRARNSFGTFGVPYTSINLQLDQGHPQLSTIGVGYSSNKTALNALDTAIITCTALDFDTIQYTSQNINIPDQNIYQESKVVSTSSLAYVDSNTNYSITAFKNSNGSTTTRNGLINIASIAPTGAITINPSGSLRSSPDNTPYTVTISSDQNLQLAPELTTSAGVWSGTWFGGGASWSRLLLIPESTPKGTANFSNLMLTNMAGIQGSTITSGASFVIGGFSTRAITFQPFSRVAPIGTQVFNTANVSCQITPTNILTQYMDNTIRPNGFYIADSNGSYNPTGDYVGLSDTALAGSNTSGTLQVSITEVSQ